MRAHSSQIRRVPTGVYERHGHVMLRDLVMGWECSRAARINCRVNFIALVSLDRFCHPSWPSYLETIVEQY